MSRPLDACATAVPCAIASLLAPMPGAWPHGGGVVAAAKPRINGPRATHRKTNALADPLTGRRGRRGILHEPAEASTAPEGLGRSAPNVEDDSSLPGRSGQR